MMTIFVSVSMAAKNWRSLVIEAVALAGITPFHTHPGGFAGVFGTTNNKSSYFLGNVGRQGELEELLRKMAPHAGWRNGFKMPSFKYRGVGVVEQSHRMNVHTWTRLLDIGQK